MSSTSSWLGPVVVATSCWALSDICCDHIIATSNPTAMAGSDSKVSPSSNHRASLSPESVALIGAALSLVLGLIGLSVLPLSDVQGLESLATLAGVLHFLSYYCLLRAYCKIPSTVITPLLQLSALLMLPLHAITGTRPIGLLTVLATVITTIGGLLPAVRGEMSLMLQSSFWHGDRGIGVGLCVLSEAFSVAYNMMMHFCTHTTAMTAYPLVDDALLSSAFAAYSRCGNGLCALSLVIIVPSLRQAVVQPMRERKLVLMNHSAGKVKSPVFRWVRIRVRTIDLLGAFVSQGLSLLGVSLAPFAYSRCPSAALVNAAEAGLQQVCNLFLAVLLWTTASIGRPASDIGVKITSAVVVLSGLYISTVSPS